ncbi:RNA polymerase sigma factor [Psychroflexus sp. CAK57W]|uniref:RNA polymerase sigma factor n=1 Tax=Psychroflexus curvus TaxID=2873595 RepID=UPI001CCF9D61|nr:RNA polymerase sigma factor [Psychroflexus curvus]MBZ9626974.1 RNA polymerase sigma factor [Psychroflexus curvus]MBZ9786968.1 RNA polymerase sigma factor [Psychroflexus curvus]
MELKNLIKRCKQNDLSSQKLLYEMFANVLFSISLKYSRNYAEAEDNLQDAFIKIFENIHQFQNKGSFEGWLKRITVNICLQRYRNQKVFELINENALKAEEIYVEDQTYSLQFLLNCIQNLPDRYRMVFNLYTLDGFSHREIAAKLQISEGTSKSNLSRAKEILRRNITEATNEGRYPYKMDQN